MRDGARPLRSVFEHDGLNSKCLLATLVCFELKVCGMGGSCWLISYAGYANVFKGGEFKICFDCLVFSDEGELSPGVQDCSSGVRFS